MKRNYFRVFVFFLASIIWVFAQDIVDLVSQSEEKFTAGAYAESIELLNTAIEENPTDAKAYRRRGRSHRFQGNLLGAVNDYNSSLNLNSLDANTFIGRAQTLLRIQNYDAAIQDYQTALTIAPQSEHKEAILYNIARIYQHQKDTESALTYYNQVLALNPNHQKSLVNRAYLNYQKNDIQTACDDWVLAKELGNQKAAQNAQKACKCCM